MAPIDGAIGMKINLDLPQTTDVNISKAQPSKVSGLGGVRCLRSKSAPILYKYRFQSPFIDTQRISTIDVVCNKVTERKETSMEKR